MCICFIIASATPCHPERDSSVALLLQNDKKGRARNDSRLNDLLQQFGKVGTKDKLKVLIADDHPLLREALHRALESEEDMGVIAEARDGEEAVKLASELKPDVVVMDIVMPKVNGIEATKKIKEIAPNIAILILTAYDDDEYVLGLLDAGAAGYLLKSVRGHDLVGAIRAVNSGESVLHPNIIAKLLKRAMMAPVEEHKHRDLLSERESEILRLVARGMSNKEIAALRQ